MIQTIKIKCQNGISFKDAVKDIFFELVDTYNFIESEEPDFVLFGPYGNDLPKRGDYIRIGYFCENIMPDLSICEFAFGIPLESKINNTKYKRIQWHGLDPKNLLKSYTDNEIDKIINTKTKFCNFLYSNPIPYREEFFTQLSKYKKIDAPGKSMNNMSSIDNEKSENIWDSKRQFLLPYKFTIAFENYVYPGYQTEKLYDAMRCNSLPIYCGDPNISEIFNTNSFINTPEYVKSDPSLITQIVESASQQDFTDYRPAFHNQLSHRLIRKLKAKGRNLKMKLQFNNLDFSPLIEKIIEIDRNQDLYFNYLKQPWFKNNRVDINTTNRNRWIEIFNANSYGEHD